MAEHATFRNRLLSGLAYAGLMLLLLVIGIMPYEIWPRRFPGPDLMVTITFVWLMRRPELLATPLVAAAFFIADILLMRPIGLWAVLMVLATEFLRNRQKSVRERAFFAEWALVSGVLFAAALLNTIIIWVVFFEAVPLDRAMIHAASTMLAYPLVAATARLALGGAPVATRDENAKGEAG